MVLFCGKDSFCQDKTTKNPTNTQTAGQTTSTGRLVNMTIQRLKNKKCTIRVFPKIGVPQNGWFIMENPEDLGVHLFLETPIYYNL